MPTHNEVCLPIECPDSLHKVKQSSRLLLKGIYSCGCCTIQHPQPKHTHTPDQTCGQVQCPNHKVMAATTTQGYNTEVH